MAKEEISTVENMMEIMSVMFKTEMTLYVMCVSFAPDFCIYEVNKHTENANIFSELPYSQGWKVSKYNELQNYDLTYSNLFCMMLK